jgi:hypothetical protein
LMVGSAITIRLSEVCFLCVNKTLKSTHQNALPFTSISCGLPCQSS